MVKPPELQRARRAVVVIDLVESVRLIEAFPDDVIERWRRLVAEVRAVVLPRWQGRMVKHLGDGMLLEFERAGAALAAALEVQSLVPPLNAGRAPEARLFLRAGVHVCEVLIDADLDVFGPGVNLTARLASLAAPGGTVVSPEVHEEAVPGLDAEFEDMGECWVKHLTHPVRAYRAMRPAPAPGAQSAGAAARPEPVMPPEAAALRPRLAVLDIAVESEANPAAAVGAGVGAGVGAATGAAAAESGAAAAAEAESLGQMLADELATLLTVNGTVELVSRLSTRRRGGPGSAALPLLQHLRAGYGLLGSCRVSGRRAELGLELQTLEPAAVVWNGTLHAGVAELLAEPAAVLRGLVAQAMAALKAHETRRAAALPIASLESYSLLMGGVTLMHRLSLSDFERGHQLLEAVAERVPRHPDAHAWLAKWHVLRAYSGWSPDPPASASMAADAAKRALDRDDQCSLALTVSGMVRTYFHRRLDEGEALYRAAIEANPNDAMAWVLKGALHSFRGEGGPAVHDTRRALALSPLDPLRYYYDVMAASAALAAQDYDEAVRMAERSLRSNSQHASTLRVLAIALAMREDLDGARAVIQRVLALEPGFTVRRFRERAPGADYPIGRTFAQALQRAGLPEG